MLTGALSTRLTSDPCLESRFYSFGSLGPLKWEGVFFKGLIIDAVLVPRGIPLFWEALPFLEASRRMYVPHLMSALNLLSQMSWFLSTNILRLAACAYNSLSPLLLKLVSLPTLSLSCSFIFIAWANAVAVKTEQNKTQCTGFCSPQALISIFLPDPYLFLYICHSSWFSSGLGFPNRALLKVWLFGPFPQDFNRNFPDMDTNHKSRVVFRYDVKKAYFCSSPPPNQVGL